MRERRPGEWATTRLAVLSVLSERRDNSRRGDAETRYYYAVALCETDEYAEAKHGMVGGESAR